MVCLQMLDRRLRSEQDAEYRQALAADQERERQHQQAAHAEAARAQAEQDAAARARYGVTYARLGGRPGHWSADV